MPELPEVETMVRDVRPALLGRTILDATLSHTDVLRGVTRPALLRALRAVGVPYAEDEIKAAKAELQGKSEMDALIAYLQGLGTALKSKAN